MSLRRKEKLASCLDRLRATNNFSNWKRVMGRANTSEALSPPGWIGSSASESQAPRSKQRQQRRKSSERSGCLGWTRESCIRACSLSGCHSSWSGPWSPSSTSSVARMIRKVTINTGADSARGHLTHCRPDGPDQDHTSSRLITLPWD